MNKKTIVIALIVVAVAAIAYFVIRPSFFSQQDTVISDLEILSIERGELRAIIGATGTVEANQSASLTFQTSGTVEYANVETSDKVTEGQELASLLESSLQAQLITAKSELITAQNALDDLLNSQVISAQAQQTLAQARDNLDLMEYRWRVQQEGYRANGETIAEAEANLVLAQNEVDRAQHEYSKYSGRNEDDPSRALARSNLADARQKRDSVERSLNWYTGSPNEIDQALLDADLAIAQAQLADAEREYERWKNGPPADEIEAAQARVAAAQANVDLARITAPFSGTITSLNVKPGDQVAPGSLALRLSDLSHLLVRVDVSEVDINQIEQGQSVTLAFDAIPDTSYQGQVAEVGIEGMPMQGIVNFEVTVELLDPDEAIKPGLTAAVDIVVNNLKNVLLVPNRSVRMLDNERVVYIINTNGTPEPVAIELGASADQYSEVIGGNLHEGDQIILNPPSGGFESMQPRPGSGLMGGGFSQ